MLQDKKNSFPASRRSGWNSAFLMMKSQCSRHWSPYRNPCFDATHISGNITFDRWIPACHSLPIFWQWTRKASLLCPWFRVGMCRTPSVHQASIQPHPSTSFHIYVDVEYSGRFIQPQNSLTFTWKPSDWWFPVDVPSSQSSVSPRFGLPPDIWCHDFHPDSKHQAAKSLVPSTLELRHFFLGRHWSFFRFGFCGKHQWYKVGPPQL